MTGRRLAPLLVLLALHLGASAEERISSSLSLCDASFASLRRCSQNLEALAAGSSCCRKLREFEAQGCTCPGCDDISDEASVEALTNKGMTWMLELQPLVDACAGDSDDALTGESAVHSASLEAPQFVQSVTEVEVHGKGTARVEEISASQASADGEWEEGINTDDEAEEEDEMLGAWEAVDSTLSALEADSAAAQVNYLADDTAVPSQQRPLPEAALYEDDDDEDATSSSDGDGEDEEGWAGTEVGSWGVEAAEIEAALQGESQQAQQAEQKTTGAELLAAEVLASSEDFPLELETTAGAAHGTTASSSRGSISGVKYEERDDGVRGQQQEVLPAATSSEQGEEQAAAEGSQEEQEVVVSHTRTIALDLELHPRSVGEAAQVLQHVLDRATSDAASLASSTLRPLSRKVSIDIRLDGTNARPLGQLLAAWLPATATSRQPSSAALASLRAQLEAQLAEQQPAEASGAACQCVGVELPPSADAQPAAVYYYMKARLALCQFSCEHRQAITVALLVELAACLAWAACILMRRARQGAADEAAAYGEEEQPVQFVVASAADPEWQKPLLQNEC